MPSRSASFSQLRASVSQFPSSQFQLPIQNFQPSDDYNQSVELFRDSEFPMLKGGEADLGDEGRAYLDHGGAALYSRSLVESYTEDLMTNLYGNPHSTSAPAELSSRRLEQVRDQALRFFNADPDEFDLVFVSNATAGIKIVMDCFRDLEATSSPSEDSPNKKQSPKKDGFWFGYHRDSHTSIVGVREVAGPNHRCFKNDGEVEKWLNDAIDGTEEPTSAEGRLGLFAYPGQSNLNGRRLPLTWPGKLRRSPHAVHRNTYSLLDAAALAPTAPLDLSDADTAPDFAVVSFYKIFGLPDLGGLIVRRRSGHILQWRKYFGGGTVEMVVCIKDAWHSKKTGSMHEQLEDGTLPFHNVIALGAAIEVHGRLFDSMESVSRHTSYLSKKMYDGLTALQHPNGLPVSRVYKEDTSTYGDSKTQGAAIAFNIQNSKGELVVYTDVERLANSNDIFLRAGGICNPGGIATYLGFAPWQMKRSFSAGHRCGTDAEGAEIVSGQPTGVVRASLGAMSTEGDVTAFLDFIREFFVEKQQLGTPLLHVTPVLRKPRTPQYQIECLRVYPIKGCGGYNIPAGMPWEVGAKGLYLDREWCIVHLDTGTALSRKRYPKMMKIRPSVDLEKGVLVISAPHSEQQPELKISLSWSFLEDGDGYRNNRRHSSSNFRASAAKVCGDPIPAHPYTSPHIVEFFSAAVGARCTLARFSASSTNSTKDLEARHTKAYLRRSYSSNAVSSLSSKSIRAPTMSNHTGSVFSSDAPQVITRPVLLPSESPISIITRTSLEWHNQQVKETRGKVAQPELFRANIVLAEMSPVETRGRRISPSVAQANIEDNWAFVRVGNMSFELLGPCSRCHLTCTDQIAAEKDHELFPVLARTRRFDGEVYFDQDPARVILRRDNPSKKPTISVGDTVRTWLSSEVYEKPAAMLFNDDDNDVPGRVGNLGNANFESSNHRHSHFEGSIILNQRASNTETGSHYSHRHSYAEAGGHLSRRISNTENGSHLSHRASNLENGGSQLSHRTSSLENGIYLSHRASIVENANHLGHRPSNAENGSSLSRRTSNAENGSHPSHRASNIEGSIILNHRTSQTSMKKKNAQSPSSPPTAPNITNNLLSHHASTASTHRNTALGSIIPPSTTTTIITGGINNNTNNAETNTSTVPSTYRPSSAAAVSPPTNGPVDVDLIEYAPLKATTFGRDSPKPTPPTRSLSGRPGARSTVNGATGSNSPTPGRAQSPAQMGAAEAERRINELTSTSRSSSEGSGTSGKWRHKIAESVVSMLDRPTTAPNF
ncbi:hypothetical protein GP486_002820 [Trichoglossum hirsutum]|uniref:Molybdenum cofactor sulfurase n=1 Tax=Trichoglossum hirsutum TaxID=265104 RepID=A0A9P8LE32_9PEZI|nr:hypothetical protein GP486_002820 [Trichoglossum hirsutum]